MVLLALLVEERSRLWHMAAVTGITVRIASVHFMSTIGRVTGNHRVGVL